MDGDDLAKLGYTVYSGRGDTRSVEGRAGDEMNRMPKLSTFV